MTLARFRQALQRETLSARARLRTLFRSARLSPSIIIFCSGSLARGTYRTGKDVDLSIIIPRHRRPIHAAIEALLYRLWNEKIKVGYSIRTPSEVVQAMRADATIYTSVLDWRVLWGDGKRAEKISARVIQTGLIPGALAYIARQRELDAERHRRFGDSPLLLEPNLFNGAGSIRDFQSAEWMRAARRLVGRTDRISRAERRRATLSFYRLLSIADRLERLDGASRTELKWERMIELWGERATVRLKSLLKDTIAVAEYYQKASGESERPTRTLVDFMASLRSSELSPKLGWSPPLAEWKRIERAIDPCHRYSVGEHTRRAIAAYHDLKVRLQSHELGTLFSLDPAALFSLRLALVFHDLGKGGRSKNHVVASLRIAERAVKKWVLSGWVSTGEAESALFLIRNHMLLSDVIRRRDVSDPRVQASVLEHAESSARLALLSVLTLCDWMATDPRLITEWRLNLMARLLRPKVLSNPSDREVLLAHFPDQMERIDRFIAAWSISTLARTANDLVSLYQLYERFERCSVLQVGWMPDPGRTAGFRALALITRDEAGLFERVAGALAVEGVAIDSAVLVTRADGTVIDYLIVREFGDPEAQVEWSLSRAERVMARLRLELCRSGGLEALVRAKERRRSRRPRVATQVVTEPGYDGESTILDITASDRTGLLFDIARALYEEGADIRYARIDTSGNEALDSFVIRDRLTGRALLPDAVQRMIARLKRTI